jgi:hypothetical protein
MIIFDDKNYIIAKAFAFFILKPRRKYISVDWGLPTI